MTAILLTSGISEHPEITVPQGVWNWPLATQLGAMVLSLSIAAEFSFSLEMNFTLFLHTMQQNDGKVSQSAFNCLNMQHGHSSSSNSCIRCSIMKKVI